MGRISCKKIDHRKRKMVGTRSERSFGREKNLREIKIGTKFRILNACRFLHRNINIILVFFPWLTLETLFSFLMYNENNFKPIS